MKDAKLNNVPQMSIGKIVRSLSTAYAAIDKAGERFSAFPSVMLWGAPGVGKSQAVRQIAKELERETGKRTAVTDVRLLLFNPIDLRGIPTANADKTLAVWLKPKIFDMDPSDKVINILFLDEISAAPQSVQAAAYQITLDRVVGEHALPDNCIVIAAGNRVTDKSVAYKMPRALANRLMHFEAEISVDGWREWAVSNGINDKVVGFLGFARDFLLKEGDDDLAYPTPRSWEMVSNVLNTVEGDVEAAYPFIAGLVGAGTAIEFSGWCRVYDKLPDIADIFKGKPSPVPNTTDALYALTSAMTAYAREHKTDMAQITNAIKYAQRLPADFSAVLLKDFCAIERGYREKLMKVPEFLRWLNEKGKLLNGSN